ncbi:MULTISPECIES: hypothetical protein [Pseudorhizobium]|jgi:hypothetical protein|uniref:Uncharacterized protein n=1 Tax=Pseudorhizobium pelagicum TaxID=1509405 RepID=A0A922TCU3_9HYPH|nr:MULTISPECIES: hypothetical protein [Pseudorhizobium]MBU1315538.1 hypothetical protein [Alphaproteobacteria bacterium]KEQ05941.1 hypothetical protein GV67_02910 [Pseudorhizobium pelagicum]KEQ11056.1 hypothetical protein GV68_01905 [Pseudorhizobium pelagicum]MBU1550869.1 hypothetical protein [Alphaproteobacteria bacterium]MBU2339005.1 hypothetical protein [Alphaproteobacteria bacterium]
MNRTEEVIERAMAAVAASRARRERQERERKQAFERIQIAMLKRPTLPKGIQVQMRLDLH